MINDLIFEKNMKILGQRYPDLARRVRETKDNPAFKLIVTPTGKPNVLIKKGSNFIILYDNDDPVKYCQHYLEKQDIKYGPIVVFMGLGLGYHLDSYFKHIAERVDTREIVIIEKDIELFRLALKVGDFGKILSHPRINLFVGEPQEDIYVRLKTEILLLKKSKLLENF